ncbi:uncharacterized protein YecT (DUF1311 family) [Sphingomonas naasensis]|uniref:DUF1311 domain-containing protein n=1 Tax=Sphingomonas naasensis TaxID=1344951 RepID=A0A4S1WQ66_9SPHN|nr:lysozyme inhibitor LprI family protein [Sphingomonas naasensis]NIJ20618.1 uncharacterized protein YecT (DUF1311 family) [Sphingomonas naasensis]TGX44695.1 DUF1311 domain-containing protein [Sphingomonas naasensis]
MWTIIALGIASFSAVPFEPVDAHRPTARIDLAERLAARCFELGSTSEKSVCLEREATKAEAAVEASFERFKARDAVDQDYTGYDPRPAMERAQRAWRTWTLADCDLQADLTRGSAGATVLPFCRLKHALHRREELDLL